MYHNTAKLLVTFEFLEDFQKARLRGSAVFLMKKVQKFTLYSILQHMRRISYFLLSSVNVLLIAPNLRGIILCLFVAVYYAYKCNLLLLFF